MGRGGHGGGARAPPKKNFYGRAKMNGTFGQNIKNSERLCLEKIFVYLRKLREVRENFRLFYVCRQVFGMSGKIFLVCPEKFLEKNFSPTLLRRNINV
jgi:hypothetical protein